MLSEPSARAEEALSQAIKLSPGMADVWNQLGECYWKQGRVAEAKDCFLGALQHVSHKRGVGQGGCVLLCVSREGLGRVGVSSYVSHKRGVGQGGCVLLCESQERGGAG